MSDSKPKDKSKKFLLPSSLRHIQDHFKNETESFVKNLNKQEQQPSSKKQQKHQSLFKLNPSSAALVSEVPIETLRKRSQSQKLESLQADPQKQTFSLLDNYKQTQQRQIHDKKPILKNYKIDIRQMVTGENKYGGNQAEEGEEQPQKYEIVKPSQPYQMKKEEQSIFSPTVFQTPILPCFASEFKQRPAGEVSKTIQEGQGLWRVGKIKVKGKKCQLQVGQFLFEGEQVKVEGKAGLVSQGALHQVPMWREMWVLEPHEYLFRHD